jgi:cytochrome c biogenesis protein CcdA
MNGHLSHIARFALVLLLLMVADGDRTALAEPRMVDVESFNVRLEYGPRVRGEVFHDTLQFRFTDGEDPTPLRITEYEVTCECVTVSLLDQTDGGLFKTLSFAFEVLQEEKDGPTEKVVYVFTDNPDMGLLRLVLEIEVRPAGKSGKPLEIPPMEVFDKPVDPSVYPERDEPLTVVMFHSPKCRTCQRVKDLVIPEVQRVWGDLVRFRMINTEYKEGILAVLAYREHYGQPEKRSPFSFYIGDTQIVESQGVLLAVHRAIDKALRLGETTWKWEMPAEQADSHTSRPDAGKEIQPLEESPGSTRDPMQRARDVFRSLSFWTVVGAGLLDGLNPCAFATIVFFISLLSYAGSTKRQILMVGIGFTTSVFTVYLLLGLGAFRALQALSAFQWISQAIYILTFLLLLVLIGLSIRDTIQYYRSGGKTTDQVLQLSTKQKRRIHGVMKKGLSTRNLFLGAFGIGALVTLFEAACTGQVYLPTIVLVLQDPNLAPNALLYLVLYNLLFVAPLIVVFALAYGGAASETFARWSKRHFGLTRVLLTLLFVALAVLMGFEIARGWL